MSAASDFLDDLLERLDRDAENDQDAVDAGDLETMPPAALKSTKHVSAGVVELELEGGSRFRVTVEQIDEPVTFFRLDKRGNPSGASIEAFLGEPISPADVIAAALIVERARDRYAIHMRLDDGELEARRIVS